MTTWSVAEVIRARAQADPAEPIVSSATQTLTAGMLDDRSSRVAQGLLAAGVVAGDRVGFVGRNELAWYELLFGAAKVGAVPVVNRPGIPGGSIPWK